MILIIGSLFILAVTAAQVWRSRDVFCVDGNTTRISEEDHSAWRQSRIAQADTPNDLARVEAVPHPSPSPMAPALAPPALVAPALVAPALAPPALAPPALVASALAPPALVASALAPPALAPPALVASADVRPELDVPPKLTDQAAHGTAGPPHADPIPATDLNPSVPELHASQAIERPAPQQELNSLLASDTPVWSDSLLNLDRLPRSSVARRPQVIADKIAPIGQVPPRLLPRRLPERVAAKGVAAKGGPAKEGPVKGEPAKASPHLLKPTQKPAPIVDVGVNQTWAEATALLNEVRELEQIPELSPWCQLVHNELENLQSSGSLGDPRAARSLRRLRSLSRVGQFPDRRQPILGQVHDEEARTRLLTSAHSVARRAAIWTNVHLVASLTNPEKRLQQYLEVDPTTMARLVTDVRSTLGNSENGKAWSEFLMLADLQEFVDANESRDSMARTFAATEIIQRWEDDRLTLDQLQFLQHPTLLVMRKEVSRWAAQPVSLSELLQKLEQFELRPTLHHGTQLAAMRLALHNSPVPEENQLSETITTYYRNANIRLSATEQLMNRLIPVIRSSNMPVRDMLFGMEVRGKGWTHAKTQVNLLPDDRRIHLALESNGKVGASTRSSTKGIELFTNNRSSFQIRKMITWDPSGMRVASARGSANAHSNLTGFRTNFDGVPLIGSIVRGLVRKGYDKRNGQARRIFENKVSTEARQTLDKQVEEQLAKLETNLNDKVIGRLNALKLDPAATDMQTSEQQVAIRLRLAGDHQLAAYTARPEPSRNNLLSLQLHESAMNNVLEQLELEGMKNDLRGVCHHIVDKLQLKKADWINDVPEDAAIEFAARDAIRISCDEGRMTIIMKIKHLEYGRSKWKYFIVKAHYQPQLDGLHIEFAREQCIELVGKRLRLGDQVALRGVFSKVFSKNRNLTVIPAALADDERLTDLTVDQLSLKNGWVGLSIGSQPPTAIARQTDSLNKSR